MVFQPSSPVRRYSDKQRAVQIRRKRTSSAAKSRKTSLNMESRPNTPSEPGSGLSRSGSLSDRLKSSFRGGMSGLLKKSQDNARLKARLSQTPVSRPSSAAAAEVINDKTENGKPVELPTKEQAIRKPTAETTNSSVVDPNYSPNSKKFRNSAGKKHLQVQAETSFFESSSDEEDESPIIQRAASVRVGKPMLIRHVSNAANAIGQSTPLRKEDDRSKTPELPTEPAEDKEDVKDGPADALRQLEGGIKPLPLTPTKPAHDSMLGGAIADSPASTVFSNVQHSPQTPPTPPITITTPLSPLSALRSNPITPTTGLVSARLSRALSAPTPPNRNPNRRVTIRPSDLVINHTDNDHRLFRESIITTPYPGSGSDTRTQKRLSDIPDVSRSNSVGDAKPHIQLLSPSALPISPHGPGDRDRFPSLTSTDTLFITLSLFNHPDSVSTLEINIPAVAPQASLSLRRKQRNRLSRQAQPQPDFDDAALFTLLRQHYLTTLIGPLRTWLLLPSRTLSHAECVPITSTTSTNDIPHLDSTDFLAQLRNPTLGKGKKGWLLWLRNNQQATTNPTVRDNRASSLFSSASTTHAAENMTAAEALNNITPPSAGASSHTPKSNLGLGIQYPRMPFRHPRPLSLGANSNTITNGTNKDTAPGIMPPNIVLHHRLNLLTLSIAGLIVLLAGVFTVVMWVVFGVPGLGYGERDQALIEAAGKASYGSWRVDAQMRVLTALMMGAVAWGGGVVVFAGWFWCGVVGI